MPIKGDQVKDRSGDKFENEVERKRERNQRNADPYLMDEGGPEPAVCTTCKTVYRNKRWYRDEKAYEELRQSSGTHKVTCAACRKIKDHYPEGIVTLRGKFFWKHEDEILNLLRSVENTAMAKNPLQRIMRIQPMEGEVTIETTEQKMAEHIGRALHSAYEGNLDIKWGEDHQVCRVYWERDD